MIKFNIPCVTGREQIYLQQVLTDRLFSGDGAFTKRCHVWIEKTIGCTKALLTTSGTHALEMAALLINLEPGDEIIMPSFTFPSTANAFVLRGSKIIFVDIRPDTMNIDEKKIEKAITKNTKAIVTVHYAGVASEMGLIMEIARKYNLFVIEDAAQALMSKYNNKYLGTIGHIGCYSFHETKNIQCGEGGALLLRDNELIERAEIIREKGTNRSKFWRGEIDKYGWVDIGSSYLPSELNAAVLYAQLEKSKEITKNRLKSWNLYYKKLKPLEKAGKIQLPSIPPGCIHNAHIFYIKLKNIAKRTHLINHLKNNGVIAVFHYLPLHSSEAGKKFGNFSGEDKYTSIESQKLLRLPMYYKITEEDIQKVVDLIFKFYSQ